VRKYVFGLLVEPRVSGHAPEPPSATAATAFALNSYAVTAQLLNRFVARSATGRQRYEP